MSINFKAMGSKSDDLLSRLGGATPADELSILWKGVNSHSIVSLTDIYGVILYANSKFCELSGFSYDELLGKPQSIVNSGHHPDTFWQEFWRHIQSGQTYRGEICNRRKDRQIYWVDTSVVPLFDQDGKIARYISLRTDISERKRLEQELQAARDQLTQMLESKTNELASTYEKLVHSGKLAALGQISSSLAHEIKNPLFVALGNLQTLSDGFSRKPTGQDPTEVRQILRKAILHLDRIKELMQVMNSFLRIGHAPTDTLPLSGLYQRTRLLLQEPLSKLGIELAPNFSCDPLIRANQSLLEQVLVNVILNAKDAFESSPHPILNPKIELEAENHGNMMKLIIRDNGPGIPPDIKDRVFDPFFTTKKAGKGTGLGLSISRQIVESVGGSISFHSHPSSGTEFIILIPRCSEDSKEKAHV